MDHSSNNSAPQHNTGRVLVAVCTFNESENIEELVTQLRQTLPQADVLVVDDRSPDGTAQIVSQMACQDAKIRVDVRNERGLGGAIRHAMQSAINEDYQWLINLDGDFSHDPARLPELLDAAVADQNSDQNLRVDVVVGSRYVAGGSIVGWSVRRRLMSRLVNHFATRVLGLPVRDCSGSMRCYRVSKLAEVEISQMASTGYSVLEEILIELQSRGAKMVEIPICFTDRTRGASKLTLSEAVRSTWKLVGMALRRRG